MKWWPWHRDKRLERARRERTEIMSKSAHREDLARRAERHLANDSFGERFRTALGGHS